MTFSGPVVSVLDGDTIEVLHNHHPERIRLSGIDCPEKGQAFGNASEAGCVNLSPCNFMDGVYLTKQERLSVVTNCDHQKK